MNEQELEQVLVDRLKNLEVEPMREAFLDEAFIKVRAFEATRTATWVKPLMGLAASVLLVGIVFMINKPASIDEAYDLVAATPFDAEKQHKLRIAFNSPGSLENVGIEIILPEGVGLVGVDKRDLSWRTNLHAGKNELSLPLTNLLKGKDYPQNEFVLARLTHGNKVKEFRVRLVRSEQA